MKAAACILMLAAASLNAQTAKPDPARKLSDEERLELVRGLSAERATMKVALPRSKKALKITPEGTWDKTEWRNAGDDFGAVGKVGDQVQVTKVEIDSDRIVLQLNGGLNLKGKWYEHIEGGIGMGGRTTPIAGDKSHSYGTTIALVYPSKLPPLKAAEVKKLLAPLLDFDKRSAAEDYFENLPPEIQDAIRARRAAVGMDREQVKLAMGQPRDRIRETVEGQETEDWIYGMPPGRITFVTFANGKVIKVKDAYAGLGGSTAPQPKPQQ